jgi:hypothetical protein
MSTTVNRLSILRANLGDDMPLPPEAGPSPPGDGAQQFDGYRLLQRAITSSLADDRRLTGTSPAVCERPHKRSNVGGAQA